MAPALLLLAFAHRHWFMALEAHLCFLVHHTLVSHVVWFSMLVPIGELVALGYVESMLGQPFVVGDQWHVVFMPLFW